MNSQWPVGLAFALLLGWPVRASLQEPNLGDLEAQLAAKKRAQQARTAEAAASVPQRKPVAAARPQPALPGATLVVRSDAACTLSFDGKKAADLAARETRSFVARSGETLVECQSVADPDVAFATTSVFREGKKVVLQIELLGKIQSAQTTRQGGSERSAVGPSRSSPGTGLSERATALRPRPPPAAATTLGQATADSAAEWGRIRAALAEDRGAVTLMSGIEVLLDVHDPAAIQFLSSFNDFLSAKHWNSAMAMGVRNGFLRTYPVWNWGRLDFVKAEALRRCDEGAGNTKCVIVWSNGKLDLAELRAVSERLGERNVEDVRAATLRDWKSYPNW